MFAAGLEGVQTLFDGKAMLLLRSIVLTDMYFMPQDSDQVRKVVSCREYDRIIFSGFEKSPGFCQSYVTSMIGVSGFKGDAENLDWQTSTVEETLPTTALNNEDMFNNIVLGGTFDRLHSGTHLPTSVLQRPCF